MSTYIVPSAAGGSPDTVSRILAAEPTKQMEQPVLPAFGVKPMVASTSDQVYVYAVT